MCFAVTDVAEEGGRDAHADVGVEREGRAITPSL